jgi:acetate kinase
MPFPQRLIIAHLGSGCSITALVNGQSVDNTMGLTPTGGIVMGSRPGDLDPGLIFYLLREPGATIDSVEHMLNHDAGLKALGGSNDLRDLRKSAAAGDKRANLALQIFSQSIRRALGGMIALHGVDAIVFTGGIGEHDREIQSLAEGLLGTQPISVHVVPAQEDLVIAIHVARMAASE